MNPKRILFLGLGNVGTQVFDEFVRVPGNHHFLVGGRNLEHVQWRTNISRLNALQFGQYPRICFGVKALPDDLWKDWTPA